jgi:hypothetical protein
MPVASDEMSVWAKIKASDLIDEPSAYLDRFPNGRYSEYVCHRLNAQRSHPAISNFRDCMECPEMVVIPSGSFTMGIPQTDIDRYGLHLGASAPLHLVRMAQLFALGEFLVTRKQFAAFAVETGHQGSGCAALPFDGTSWKFDPALSWRDPGFAQADNHPVVCVSWDDAIAYASWLSKKTGRRGGSWNSVERHLYNVGTRAGAPPCAGWDVYGFRVARDYPAPASAPSESPTVAQAARPAISSPAAPQSSDWDGTWAGSWGRQTAAKIIISGGNVEEYDYRGNPQKGLGQTIISGNTLTFGTPPGFVITLTKRGSTTAAGHYHSPVGEADACLVRQ